MNTDEFEGHTPGPWTANCWADPSITYFTDPSVTAGELHICAPNWTIPFYEMNANTRLIAAAPDLLARVKRLEDILGWTIQVWRNDNYMTRQDWMEGLSETYDDLARKVEGAYHGGEEE